MPITYPLTLPALPDFNGAKFTGISTVGITTSAFTGSSQVQQHQGEWWSAQLSLPPMKRVLAADWQAFLLSLGGLFGTFYLGDPLGRTAQGTVDGTPLVDGAAQTGKTLDTKGWTPGDGVLLAGDYIQIGSGTTQRLYQVLVDVDTDSGGLATLDIWPRLRESPADSAAITISDTKGVFRLRKNLNSWDMNVAEYYGFSFDAVEAF